MRKELFNAIKAKLASDVPEVQHVDLWNHNVEFVEQEERVRALYDIMHKELYEFFRSELMEKLLPRCSCGANTYCRCE